MRRSLSTSAAAVSSQLDSRPRLRVILLRVPLPAPLSSGQPAAESLKRLPLMSGAFPVEKPVPTFSGNALAAGHDFISDPRKPAAYRHARVAAGDGSGTYGGCGADFQPWHPQAHARHRADDRDGRQDLGPG